MYKEWKNKILFFKEIAELTTLNMVINITKWLNSFLQQQNGLDDSYLYPGKF